VDVVGNEPEQGCAAHWGPKGTEVRLTVIPAGRIRPNELRSA
jgi:hypothetical protein